MAITLWTTTNTKRWRLEILLLFALWNNVYAQGPLDYYKGRSKFVCPETENWFQIGTSCFYLEIGTSRSWPEASKYCQDQRGYLSTMNDWIVTKQFVQRLSLQYPGQNMTLWMGFRLNITDPMNPVLWSPRGEVPRYSSLWGVAEPNVSLTPDAEGFECVGLNELYSKSEGWYGAWSTMSCLESLPFICQAISCLPNQFRCHDNSRCINSKWECDHFEDCMDASDEKNCSDQGCTAGPNPPPLHPSGHLSSPGFSSQRYPPMADCTWHITANKRTYRLRLKFNAFDTEMGHDILEIRDGVNWDSAFLVANYSGTLNETSKTYRSATDSLWLHFTSDRNYARTGFNVSFEDDDSIHNCDTDLTANSVFGNEFDFSGYPQNLLCTWKISSSNLNYLVSIEFLNFELAANDVLEVFDSSTADNSLIDTFNSSHRPQTVVSSQNVLTVRFHSLPGTVGRGFKFLYKQGCSLLAIDADSGSVESPGFWNPHGVILQDTVTCSWALRSQNGQPITFIFNNFNITGYDSISIFESESSTRAIAIYTQAIKPSGPLRGSTGTFFVVFNATRGRQWSGFKSSFSIDCAPLSESPHLEFSPKNRTYGTVVRFSCASGYILKGSPTLECIKDAKWSGEIPKCKPVRCTPPKMQNGWLTRVSDIVFGSTVSYSCYNGYSSSGSATCSAFARWEPPITCNIVNCGPPPRVTNASSEYTETFFGNQTQYSCFPGYVPSGVNFSVCLQSGLWSEPTFRCRAVVCKSVPVPYGRLLRIDYPVGPARVKCLTGFLPSQNHLNCTTKGMWSATPSCSDVNECSQSNVCNVNTGPCTNEKGSYFCNCNDGFSMIVNGSCTDIDECQTNMSACESPSLCKNTDGSYECSCNPGYRLYKRGMFSQTSYLLPNRSCIPVRCGRPQHVHMRRSVLWTSSSLYTYGTNVKFYCNSGFGFLRRGYKSITCDQDGNWDKLEPQCLDVHCNKSELTIENGRIIKAKDVYKPGDVVQFQCGDDFELSGLNRVVCFQDILSKRKVHWVGLSGTARPTCKKKQCRDVKAPENGFMTYSKFSIGERIQFYCRPGYRLIGNDTLVCQEDQSWNGTEPLCAAGYCAIPAMPQLVGLEQGSEVKIKVGDSAQFRCLKEGFSLSRSKSLNCIVAGDFSSYPGLSSGAPRPRLRLHPDTEISEEDETPTDFNLDESSTPQPSEEASTGEPRCYPLPEDSCPELPYSNFQLPNLIGHTNPAQAKRYWERVAVSTATQECKDALRQFLCIPLYPACGVRPMPCKSLCVAAKRQCSGEDLEAPWKWTGALGCDFYPEQDCLTLMASSNEVAAVYSSSVDLTSDCLQSFQRLVQKHLLDTWSSLDTCSGFTNNSKLIMVAAELLEKRTFRLHVKLGEMIHDCVFEIASLVEMDLKNLTAGHQDLESECGFVKLKFPINLNSDSALRIKRSSFDGDSQTGNESAESECKRPIIEFITSDTYVSLGDTVVLMCSIRDQCEGYLAMWEKQTDGTSNNILYDERRSFIYEGNSQKLKIIGAKTEDSGYYWCKVWKDNEIREKSGLLLVVNDTLAAKKNRRRRPIDPLSLSPNTEFMLDSTDRSFDTWTHNNIGNGVGWRIPDKTGRTVAPIFEVCDITAGQPNSWLRSPYIPNNASQQTINLEIEYSQLPCRSFFSSPVLCSDTLKILMMGSDTPISVDTSLAWNVTAYTVLNSISASGDQTGRKDRIHVEFQPRHSGFYVALQDIGSCTMVYGFTLYFLTCKQFRAGLTVFPETFSPTTKTGMISVPAECVPGGQILPSQQPVLWCDSSGHWRGDRPNSACICMPGYIHVGSSCIQKGPRCYACIGARSMEECNRRATVEQCRPDEVCGMENVVGGALNKGCIKPRDCMAHTSHLISCLSGSANCTLCCAEDYCNFPPYKNFQDLSRPIWDGEVPQCLDTSLPKFINCSQKDLIVPLGFGSLSEPVEIPWPRAEDNSGEFVMEVEPEDLGPVHVFSSDTQVTFTAKDAAGLKATCSFSVSRRDMHPPKIRCNESVVIDIFDEPENVTSVHTRYPRIPVIEQSPVVSEVFQPPQGTLVPLNNPIDVTFTATDAGGNSASCQFRYLPKPSGCPEWSLPVGYANSEKVSCANSPYEKNTNMKICTIEAHSCNTKWQPSGPFAFSCQSGGEWREMKIPSGVPSGEPLYAAPICTAMKTPPILFTFQSNFTVISRPSEGCLIAYANSTTNQAETLFHSKCRELLKESKVAGSHDYQLGVRTTQSYRMNLISVTINTNLSTSQTFPVYNVFLYCMREFRAGALSQDSFQRLQVPGCRTAQVQNKSFVLEKIQDCPRGYMKEIRRGSDTLDYVCVQCSAGFYENQLEQNCSPCPRGSYQSVPGQSSCTRCPSGTDTAGLNRRRAVDCLSICGRGLFSKTGLEPCNSCPSGTYQPDVQKNYCIPCRNGTTTPAPGAKTASQCLAPCRPGFFSGNGLAPCHMCPRDYYQSEWQQWSCVQCPRGMVTLNFGSTHPNDCRRKLSCQFDTCRNGGRCKEGPVKPSCVCLPGYAGPDCSISLNYCMKSPCINNGSCTQTRTGFSCICPLGFSGKYCEHQQLDSQCSSSTCIHGTCQELPDGGGVHCVCNSGYTGPWCNVSKPDPCQSANCHGGTCLEVAVNSFICKCPEGRTGPLCQNVTDLCGYENELCVFQTTESCANNTCLCKSGWKGVACQSPALDCSTDPNYCLNGTCVMLPRNFSETPSMNRFCVCSDQYEGDRCDRLRNACASSPCQNNSTCIDHHSYYECLCPKGYYGLRCEVRDHPCNSSPCKNAGRCMEIKNSNFTNYTCKCRPGFTGQQCEKKMNMCHTGFNNCSLVGTMACLPTYDSISCLCKPGYTGQQCEAELRPCSSSPCASSGTCVEVNGTDYRCVCPVGWAGPHCTVNVQCAFNTCTQNATCVVVFEPEPLCLCPRGYTGKFCADIIPHCQRHLCLNNGTCINVVNGYGCLCEPGFSGEYCQNPVPCETLPCKNNGTCYDQMDSFGDMGYRCVCPPEYTGKECERKIDWCSVNNPCLNGATCISTESGPQCLCAPMFDDKHCDKEKPRNFNLHFTGDLLPETTRIVSPAFDGYLLQIMTLCFWVKFNNVPDDSANMVYLAIFPVADHQPDASRQIGTSSDAFLTFKGSRIISGGREIELLVNNGRWHHVCFKWRPSITGDWLTYLDGSMASMSNRSSALRTPLSAKKYQIILGQSETGSNRFDGELSLVHLFNTWIDESEIHQMAMYCLMWLNLDPLFRPHVTVRWNSFAKPVAHDATVLKVYPGICELATCLPGNRNCTHDKIPPVIKNNSCPTNVSIDSRQRLNRVNWTAPEFTDNVEVMNVTSNYRPLQVFTWGEFQIVYIAQDPAGNTAICTFRVYVTPSLCPLPSAPVDGEYKTGTWSQGRYAEISCKKGFSFSHAVKPFYSCGVQGSWDPLVPTDLPFLFPPCAPIEPPIQRVSGKMALDSNSCTDWTAEMLRRNMTNFMRRFGIASSVIEMDVRCDRAKRQVPERNLFSRRVDLLVDVWVESSSSVESVEKLLDTELLAGSFSASLTCREGAQLRHGECVQCPVGEFYNVTAKLCQDCPVNTYQDKSGQLNCTQCPDHKITVFPKAQSLRDCILNCPVGEKYNYTIRNCTQCQLGTYQPNKGQIYCIQCPQGESTSREGAKNATECIFPCPAGQELDPDDSCVNCSRGTYKSRRNQTACIPCPYTTTTPDTGATSIDNCTEIWCPPGKYVEVDSMDSENDTCRPCPLAQYQSQYNQTECIPCPPHLITISPGATSVKDCVPGRLNWCEYGLDDCSDNATCYDCPLCRRGYNCSCNRGFAGNGTFCALICDPSAPFCYNGGRCYADNGKPKCECPAGWKGERCNGEPAESEKTKSLIVGGVAGGIVFIILVVSLFVIFKVRIPYFLYCCKSPSLKDISTTQYYRNTNYSVGGGAQDDSEMKEEEEDSEDLKTAYDMMSPTDVYNEIYAGLQGLQADRTLSDYLGHSDYFEEDDGHAHSTPPPPIMPISTDAFTLAPYYENRAFHRESQGSLDQNYPIMPSGLSTFVPRPTIIRGNGFYGADGTAQFTQGDSDDEDDSDYFA